MPYGSTGYSTATYGEGSLFCVTGRPQLLVEIAFLPPTQVPVESDWVDFSDQARGNINITRGRERVFDDFSPGTCSLSLESTDRRFDPLNATGPYFGDLKPNRWLRVSGKYGYDTYRRFTGFIDAWDQQYESKNYATVRITATDALRRLAAQDVVQPFLIVGKGRIGRSRVATAGSVAAERTGARVARVLSNVGITDYDVDTGSTVLPLGQGEGNVLEYLRKVTRTEDGRLYVSASGVITFRGRYASSLRPEMRDSNASFGAQGVADHFVTGMHIAPHIAELYNHVVVNLDGGGQAEAEDAASIAEYDRRTYSRDVLVRDPVAGARIARHILTRHKDPIPRLSKVVLEPDGDPDDMFPAVFARELGDRITAVGTPQEVGTPISQEAHIEGISEEIDIEAKRWKTTWSLSAADMTDYLVIGRGLVGTGRVAA